MHCNDHCVKMLEKCEALNLTCLFGSSYTKDVLSQPYTNAKSDFSTNAIFGESLKLIMMMLTIKQMLI